MAGARTRVDDSRRQAASSGCCSPPTAADYDILPAAPHRPKSHVLGLHISRCYQHCRDQDGVSWCTVHTYLVLAHMFDKGTSDQGLLHSKSNTTPGIQQESQAEGR